MPPCDLMRRTSLNFAEASLVHNNLGGYGPAFDDPPELRYTNVQMGDLDAGLRHSFDLVVTNTTKYLGVLDDSVAANGMTGDFGQLGIFYGATAFRFQFVETGGTAPFAADELAMTFYDFDRGKNSVLPGGKGKKCREMIRVTKPDFERRHPTTTTDPGTQPTLIAIVAQNCSLNCGAAFNPTQPDPTQALLGEQRVPQSA